MRERERKVQRCLMSKRGRETEKGREVLSKKEREIVRKIVR